MKYDTLHESVVKDITDALSDVNGAIKDNIETNPSISRASSLTKATSGLTLVFPVLCSKTLPLDTATMISKAVEKKAVSLLQIAFSAFNITNSKDATQFIKNFHTNLKGKIGVDDFIDAMDSYANESGLIPKERIGMYKAVMEDLRNINYTFNDDISESSINDFKVRSDSMGNFSVVKEDKDPEDLIMNMHKREQDKKNYDLNKDKFNYQRQQDYLNNLRSSEQDKKEDQDRKRKAERDNIQNRKDTADFFKNQLISSDVKKANEMVPTMMIVNLITTDSSTQSAIDHPVVIGVKAKLYPVDSQDVINKLITKRVDSNILLKFIKASTREISFVKDFIFAIDNAKLSAVANSKNGSQTNRLLKVLERRALGGKIRKAFKVNNAYKAISTLVISKEEAEEILRTSNIDIMKPNIIRQIMESLNLMMFIVADESEESASIIMDSGDDTYEVISYNHLEREASDNSSKKIVNLMTKVAR